MEAIRLHETVTEQGLLLNNPKLRMYLNRKVEITILPIDEDDDSEFWELAGSLDPEDLKAFEESLASCRRIEQVDEGRNGKLFD